MMRDVTGEEQHEKETNCYKAKAFDAQKGGFRCWVCVSSWKRVSDACNT